MIGFRFWCCLWVVLIPVFAGMAIDPVRADGLENTAPPEVLDIDDPFSRDLKRAAEDATGGLSFGSDGLTVNEEEETGRELLGRESRIALIANKYRVMGVAVSRKQDQNQIYVNVKEDLVPGAKPLMNYLRIGSHDTIDEARQQAINIKASYTTLLDAAFIIRQNPSSSIVDLDIGPFREISHGERYCDMLLASTFGLVSDCYVVQEFPGIEPVESFTSTAMMRFSADAVDNVVQDTTVFDLPAAADQIITVREGDTIGTGTTQVVKIMDTGMMVVDEIGTVVRLPLVFIPEDAYVETTEEPTALPTIPLPDGGSEDDGPPVIQEETRTAADILLDEN
ncbi:MAG: hypothetical protein ACON4P_09790 [Candidatus Puniceispirillales bacterium]